MSGTGDMSLVHLVTRGEVTKVRQRLRYSGFLKSREIVNTRDPETGRTLAHLAAMRGDMDMVSMLVSKGARLNMVDSEGRTALHDAASLGDREMVELLLSEDDAKLIDIKAKSKTQQTPLHLAIKAGHVEVVISLLEAGARTDLSDSQGWPGLHLAVVRGEADCVMALLHHEAEVSFLTRGWAPLHLAVVTGREDIVSLLVNRGADTEQRNSEGRTALDIARAGTGRERIAAVILEREFRAGAVSLPTPPPTPGSERKLGTLERWRMELQEEMERESEEEGEEEGMTVSDCQETVIGSDNGHRTKEMMTNDITEDINAKDDENYDVLRNVLMQQLESVKEKQRGKIRSDIEIGKKLFNHAIERISKRAQVVLHEITQLRLSVPETQESIKLQFDALKDDILNISRQLEVTKKETGMITELLNRNNDRSRCHRNHPKLKVIHKLAELHEREMRELKELKMIKLKSMEQCEKDCEKKVKRIDNKIRVLENELKNLAKDKVKRTNQHSLELLGLEEDLKRLESSIVVEEGLGHYSCPVCFGILKPAGKVFQCQEGHILCGECNVPNETSGTCLQCPAGARVRLSRNRALEAFIKSFNAKPSSDI